MHWTTWISPRWERDFKQTYSWRNLVHVWTGLWNISIVFFKLRVQVDSHVNCGLTSFQCLLLGVLKLSSGWLDVQYVSVSSVIACITHCSIWSQEYKLPFNSIVTAPTVERNINAYAHFCTSFHWVKQPLLILCLDAALLKGKPCQFLVVSEAHHMQ